MVARARGGRRGVLHATLFQVPLDANAYMRDDKMRDWLNNALCDKLINDYNYCRRAQRS